MTDQLLTDLEDLLSHQGWSVLLDHAEQEWGKVGFAEKIAKTLGAPKATAEARELALHQLEQATVTQREIWRLLNWPAEQIHLLRAKQKEALLAGTGSRRGPGL